MKVNSFISDLENNGISAFFGVPDSLLSSLCAYLQDNKKDSYTITVNEGSAIGMAIGHYLFTQEIPCVFMQNSGIGNAINPLLSMAHKDVYSIPCLLLIGMRGDGYIDEPQHRAQGRLTRALLNSCEIPNSYIDEKDSIQKAINYIKKERTTYALLVKKNYFEKYILQNKKEDISNFTREQAIKEIVNRIDSSYRVISTTGMISRELFETRESLNMTHENDFLCVGAMGHASSIALEIARKSNKNILCIEGDGSVLMHMGVLSTIGYYNLHNFKHIILNNNAHDSVGGQPTTMDNVDICSVAKACGYKYVYSANDLNSLNKVIDSFLNSENLALLEVKVKKGARADLGRPTISTFDCKKSFIEHL